jgi:APA family basic amino acid/polyamine antiporter
VARLRRALGTAGVYAIGYGNVGSSIYYALGIVAAYALGATPIALALAGIIFIFTAMTYAEGVSMVPTAGGSVAFARRAFNDLFSFVAGWALTLNYIVTTAISAVTATFYLSYFYAPFKTQPALAAIGGIILTGLLMLLNLRGVRETARLNIGFAVIDLATQGLLVLLGISLVLGGWRNLISYPLMGPEFWPEPRQLIFAVAIAMVAYVGLESAAQMAEETKTPTRTVPRALFWSVLTVLFMFAALPIVALCAMPPTELVQEWGNDPVAGIASQLPDWTISAPFLQGRLLLSKLMMPWVAILACTILLIAANAGILAGSRITYNMAHHKQLLSVFGFVHPKFHTPSFAIAVISAVACAIIAVGMKAEDLLLKMGDLYVFSSMMAFSMAGFPGLYFDLAMDGGQPRAHLRPEHRAGMVGRGIGVLHLVQAAARVGAPETRGDGGVAPTGVVVPRAPTPGNDAAHPAHSRACALEGVRGRACPHRMRPQPAVHGRDHGRLCNRGAEIAGGGRESRGADAGGAGRVGHGQPHSRDRVRHGV